MSCLVRNMITSRLPEMSTIHIQKIWTLTTFWKMVIRCSITDWITCFSITFLYVTSFRQKTWFVTISFFKFSLQYLQRELFSKGLTEMQARLEWNTRYLWLKMWMPQCKKLFALACTRPLPVFYLGNNFYIFKQ